MSLSKFATAIVVLVVLITSICLVMNNVIAQEDKSEGLHGGLIDESITEKKQDGKNLSVMTNPVAHLSGIWMQSEYGTNVWFYKNEDIRIQMLFFVLGDNGNIVLKIKIKGKDAYGNTVKRNDTYQPSISFLREYNGYVWYRPSSLPPGTYDATIKIKKGSIKGSGSAKIRFFVAP